MSFDLKYSKLVLIPEIYNKKVKDFPFSYEFIAQTLHNGSKREYHENLNNRDIP